MNLSRQESHWYSHNPETGAITPCYETSYADPSKGMRRTTLADAKKRGLLVGISTIANMLPKENLINWRIEQGIMAALTLPRLPNESEDAFCKRVIEDSEAQSLKAREWGTEIHNAIENHLNGVQKLPDHLDPYLDGFRDWAAKNIEDIHALELTVGDPALGIAGKLDIDCTLRAVGRTVIDTKTQRIKDGKAKFWDTFPIQLSAYAHGRERELPGVKLNICSLIINSAEPGPVHVNLWLGGRQQYWEVFQHCLALWRYTTNYNPAQL
jgi:hypothetical protein